VLDGDTLLIIHAELPPFTVEQRAAAISERLRSIRSRGAIDSVWVRETAAGSNIVADSTVIMVVTDEDATGLGIGRDSAARQLTSLLHERLITDAGRYRSSALLIAGAIALGLLLALLFAFWLMGRLFPRLYARLEGWEGSVIRPVKFRSQVILTAGSVSAAFIIVLKGIRLALSLVLVYSFLTYVLTLFPWTRGWNVAPVLVGILLSILSTAAALFLFRTCNTVFALLVGKVDGWKGTVIKPVTLKTVVVFSEDRIGEVVAGALRILRFACILVLGYFYITILFSFFDFTHTWARTLFGYIVNPLWNVFTAFSSYLPNLFFILVIAYVTRYVIKLTRLIFDEIGKGVLTLPGFYREWADPTYKIVRFLILAFAVIVIFPYLPGSESPIFRGITVFFGILFSLGSTSAVGNVVAGVVLTYMRPFRIGDRVKIADTVGDVVEKTLLVTRVRTIKNVDITVPNAMVMGSHIINFSSSAKDPGLILNTAVTIGYDAPWPTVHALLIAAAEETANILGQPKPFVLQTSLDDFYVRYELNAYTERPNEMARTYSELHQHIQDRFNEAGVEIMSPHYGAIRDGNRIAIPDDHLPGGYQPPAFRVAPAGRAFGKKDGS